MALILLGFLSTALLGSLVYNLFDGDDGDSDDRDDELPPEEMGRELTFDDSDTLEGTEGDDTLSSEQDFSQAPSLIDLLGGDDLAVLDLDDQITISGGEGNDSIAVFGVLNTVLGGEGDDVLAGDDSNHLIGGEGDDRLLFHHGSFDQGESGSADGGAGDDTITVRTDAFVPAGRESDLGGVEVTGGEGADEIEISYLNNLDFDFEAHPDVEAHYVRITDFDPSEDTLIVQVDQVVAALARDFTVDLDQTEEADGSFTSLITLTFPATEEDQEATNILTVLSPTAFTLDDIQLLGAA